ncbi:AS3MT [Mytilus coruscus]|uniref:AS3MT n=1 Tax=Mytilus coruscus TaxID=42192 RepID=A0A6J8E9A0_MYTCO|nr:AS3MT [Mytilus coruscus]
MITNSNEPSDAKFCSVTYRLFKLPKVEKSPPLQVIYSGDVTGCENQLDFDHRNHFKTGDVYTIDSELVTILKNSRFSDEFEFQPATKGICGTTGNTCYMILLRLKASLGNDGGIDEDSIVDSVDPNADEDLDTKTFLNSKLDDFQDIQSKLSSDTNTNLESIVLNEMLIRHGEWSQKSKNFEDVIFNLSQFIPSQCRRMSTPLLADSLDSYSGSTKLVTMFNTFGIFCSKKISKEYITSIANKKLSSKFIDDLILNAFTIVSVDNIDFGQPNACVRLDGSRGIHATSYQAVQPKLNTIKFQNVDVKSRSNAINKDLELLNFSLSETERNAMSQTEKSMFQYIIQKLASDDGDIRIPDLKSNMAAFDDSTTEKANVVYLGVIDAPCDNNETIRHTLEKIHETISNNNTVSSSGQSNNKFHNEISSCYLKKVTESNVFKNDLGENRGLMKLFTAVKAEGSVYHDLMHFYEIGKQSLEHYINSRILKIPSINAPVRKHVLKTFSPARAQTTKKKKMTEEKEKVTYNLCLKKEVAHSMKTGQPLNSFRQYVPLPRAICTADGKMNHQDTKANATKHLNTRYESLIIETLPNGFNPEVVILEGMLIINSAPIRSHHKTFNHHIQYLVRRWILPHIKSGSKEIHVLFDRPGALKENNTDSLKNIERLRRDNLAETYKTILNINLEAELPPGQTFVLAGCSDTGTCYGVSYTSEAFEIEQLRSNHEETDTLIWLHVKKCQYSKILVFSPDTDVYFIGLSLISGPLSSKNIIVQKNMLAERAQYLSLNDLAHSLTRDPDVTGISNLAKCIQVLYICSGCDNVSFFVGFGKAFFFSTLFQYAQFISGLQPKSVGMLCDTSPNSKDNGFLSFLRLIGSLYFKKHITEFLPECITPGDLFKDVFHKCSNLKLKEKHCRWLDIIREKVQVRVSYEDQIPPSATSLKLHWLRSCLVSQMYDQATENTISLPSFCSYGYRINTEKNLEPVWEKESHMLSVQSHGNQKCGPGCSCTNCQNCSQYKDKCIDIEVEEDKVLNYQNASDSEEDESVSSDTE